MNRDTSDMNRDSLKSRLTKTNSEGWIAGKRGHVWCESEDPNIQSGWFEIEIGSYHSAQERNKERGMYFFTMVDKRNGNETWTDYFSDDDETVMVDGLRGRQLWS